MAKRVWVAVLKGVAAGFIVRNVFGRFAVVENMIRQRIVTYIAKAAVVAGVFVLVGCDHATKLAARENLKGRPEVKLIPGVLDLRYAENRAMSFGMLGSVPEPVRRPVITIFHTVALLALGVFTWRLRRKGLFVVGGLCLALAGGAANLADRLGRGYVVDFIHLHHWPVFNIADIYITAGVAALVVCALRDAVRGPPGEPAR